MYLNLKGQLNIGYCHHSCQLGWIWNHLEDIPLGSTILCSGVLDWVFYALWGRKVKGINSITSLLFLTGDTMWQLPHAPAVTADLPLRCSLCMWCLHLLNRWVTMDHHSLSCFCEVRCDNNEKRSMKGCQLEV